MEEAEERALEPLTPTVGLVDHHQLLDDEPTDMDGNLEQRQQGDADLNNAVQRFSTQQENGREKTDEVVGFHVDVRLPLVVDDAVANGLHLGVQSAARGFQRVVAQVEQEVFAFFERLIRGGRRFDSSC